MLTTEEEKAVAMLSDQFVPEPCEFDDDSNYPHPIAEVHIKP
jgi:hypothetical protein